jgi:hypothetical protein
LVLLFEFVKDLPEQALHIPIQFPKASDVTVSFWFVFRGFPPSSQDICSLHSVHIRARGDELLTNGESLFHLSKSENGITFALQLWGKEMSSHFHRR